MRTVPALMATMIHLAQLHSVNAYSQIHQQQFYPLGIPSDVLMEVGDGFLKDFHSLEFLLSFNSFFIQYICY